MRVLILLLFLASSLIGFEEDIEKIRQLILTTEQNLDLQKKLLQALVSYSQTRTEFMKKNESRQLASDLVQRAMRLELLISENAFAHLFSTEFLNEVHYFDQIGKRRH